MSQQTSKRSVAFTAFTALLLMTCGWLPFEAPVTINTAPQGAEIYEDGELVGTTPFKTRVFFTGKSFELRKGAFFSEFIEVPALTQAKVTQSLMAIPILIESTPKAELIAPDGTSLGQTPVIIDMPEVDATYTLKLKDYYDKTITVGLDSELTVATTLERRPIITLNTSPAGVEIYENGKKIATGSITREILKKRIFDLRKDGYWSKKVTLTSKSPYTVLETLTELPLVTLKATPSDASIKIVGSTKALGTGSVSVKIAEKTSFKVSAKRYYPQKVTLDPKAQTKRIKLKAMPYVKLSSTPAGADVYLNNQHIGATPLRRLVETPETLELRKEGYISQTVELNGKKAKVPVQLEEVPPSPVIEEVAVVEEVAPVVVEPVKKKSFWQKLFGK